MYTLRVISTSTVQKLEIKREMRDRCYNYLLRETEHTTEPSTEENGTILGLNKLTVYYMVNSPQKLKKEGYLIS